MAHKRFVVERLFTLGDYKNIKFISEIILEDAELDIFNAEAVYDSLMDDVYQAYFAHTKALRLLKEAGPDVDEQVAAWNNRNREV